LSISRTAEESGIASALLKGGIVQGCKGKKEKAKKHRILLICGERVSIGPLDRLSNIKIEANRAYAINPIEGSLKRGRRDNMAHLYFLPRAIV
jgi:hypothetical protein